MYSLHTSGEYGSKFEPFSHFVIAGKSMVAVHYVLLLVRLGCGQQLLHPGLDTAAKEELLLADRAEPAAALIFPALQRQQAEVHVCGEVSGARQEERVHLLVVAEGPQRVSGLPCPAVVDYEGSPAPPGHALPQLASEGEAGRAELHPAAVRQQLPQPRLLQHHTGRGGVAGSH